MRRNFVTNFHSASSSAFFRRYNGCSFLNDPLALSDNCHHFPGNVWVMVSTVFLCFLRRTLRRISLHCATALHFTTPFAAPMMCSAGVSMTHTQIPYLHRFVSSFSFSLPGSCTKFSPIQAHGVEHVFTRILCNGVSPPTRLMCVTQQLANFRVQSVGQQDSQPQLSWCRSGLFLQKPGVLPSSASSLPSSRPCWRALAHYSEQTWRNQLSQKC